MACCAVVHTKKVQSVLFETLLVWEIRYGFELFVNKKTAYRDQIQRTEIPLTRDLIEEKTTVLQYVLLPRHQKIFEIECKLFKSKIYHVYHA